MNDIEDLDTYMSDVYNFPTYDHDEDFEEEWEEDTQNYKDEYNLPEIVEVVEESFVSYTEWLKSVDEKLGLQSDFLHSVETICYESDFYDWWENGVSPIDAAEKALSEYD